MPFVELANSPHAPGICPVKIFYRDVGEGQPLVFLHGGWGYGAYPITWQLKAFKSKVRFISGQRKKLCLCSISWESSARCFGDTAMER